MVLPGIGRRVRIGKTRKHKPCLGFEARLRPLAPGMYSYSPAFTGGGRGLWPEKEGGGSKTYEGGLARAVRGDSQGRGWVEAMASFRMADNLAMHVPAEEQTGNLNDMASHVPSPAVHNANRTCCICCIPTQSQHGLMSCLNRPLAGAQAINVHAQYVCSDRVGYAVVDSAVSHGCCRPLSPDSSPSGMPRDGVFIFSSPPCSRCCLSRRERPANGVMICTGFRGQRVKPWCLAAGPGCLCSVSGGR